MEEKYLSDSQIAEQYEGFKITESSCERLRFADGFSGCLCIDFPNADHPDFNESVCKNWISYDSQGKKIAFDNWYPENVYNSLCKIVRIEIQNYYSKFK